MLFRVYAYFSTALHCLRYKAKDKNAPKISQILLLRRTIWDHLASGPESTEISDVLFNINGHGDLPVWRCLQLNPSKAGLICFRSVVAVWKMQLMPYCYVSLLVRSSEHCTDYWHHQTGGSVDVGIAFDPQPTSQQSRPPVSSFIICVLSSKQIRWLFRLNFRFYAR